MSGAPGIAAGRPLAGQAALVTGATGGIGRVVAATLAAAGADLALLDVEPAALEAVAEAARAEGVRAHVQPIELADAAAIAPAVETALAALGRLDILVNCAGVTGPTPRGVLDTEAGDWDRVFAINARAPFLLIQHVGRHMVGRGSGRIVNITSSSAHRARQSPPAYGASKAALMQLTRSAAADLGPHGINVNAVAPGLTATRMVSDAFTPEALAAALREGPIANLLQRVSEPQDIAQAVLFLCLPASRQITAQTLHVSAGAIV